MPHLPALAWVLLAVSTIFVGISKTALPGTNSISVAVFAAILPAKQSTAALLVLLLLGDALAIWSYRRDAHWPTLRRLFPSVALGIGFGALLLWSANDLVIKRVIGVVLLLLLAFTLWRRRTNAASLPLGPVARVSYGALGGFTTTVANAGGPVMSMYLLASNFQPRAFLGTAAWFFAIVNLAKLPFAIGLGLLNTQMLSVALVLAPCVVLGAIIGRLIISRISQRFFEAAVIGLTIIGATYLVVG